MTPKIPFTQPGIHIHFQSKNLFTGINKPSSTLEHQNKHLQQSIFFLIIKDIDIHVWNLLKKQTVPS